LHKEKNSDENAFENVAGQHKIMETIMETLFVICGQFSLSLYRRRKKTGCQISLASGIQTGRIGCQTFPQVYRHAGLAVKHSLRYTDRQGRMSTLTCLRYTDMQDRMSNLTCLRFQTGRIVSQTSLASGIQTGRIVFGSMNTVFKAM
jgi:hypothetical protein